MNSLEQDEGAELTDGEYVVSSRNGCPDHFRLLVQRYQRPLFAYLSSRLGNHLEAEEAAQESFVRAFMSLKKLRKPESFYAWLLGIAGRVLKEQFRAVERRQRDRAVAETLLAEDPGSAPEYPLEEAIAVLPESYRQVILHAVLRGALLSGCGHTPRDAAGHRHQNAFTSLCPAAPGAPGPGKRGSNSQMNATDMNCAECRDNLVACLEGLLEAEPSRQCQAHLESCAACRAEYEAISRLQERLAARGRVAAEVSLVEPVMRVVHQQTKQNRKGLHL